MIKIEGLTKKYRSKARTTCVALDSIDLVLPDKGMVFVIGKSGSGKSTLLNILGGRNPDIRRIFVTKTLVVGFIISVLSVALSVTFLGAADDILVSSIETTANISLHGLDIIKVIPSLLIFDGLILLGVVILSSLTTSLILRSIKPVEIIKAKE